MKIMQTQLQLKLKLKLKLSLAISQDANGNEARCETRAVIEYRGQEVSTGVSMGHYTYDVRDNKTWYRTNDFQNPEFVSSVKGFSRAHYIKKTG